MPANERNEKNDGKGGRKNYDKRRTLKNGRNSKQWF
jgi:hypothetical protein